MAGARDAAPCKKSFAGVQSPGRKASSVPGCSLGSHLVPPLTTRSVYAPFVKRQQIRRRKPQNTAFLVVHVAGRNDKSFPVETDDYFCQVVRYVERNTSRANLVADHHCARSGRQTGRENPEKPGVP